MVHVYGLYKKNYQYKTKKIDDGLFYIGITKNTKKRIISHRSKDINPIKRAIINKYDFEIKILYSYETYDEAIEMEAFLIKWFGRICDNSGILSNILSHQNEISSFNKGKVFDEKHRLNMSKKALERDSSYLDNQRDQRLSLNIKLIHNILKEWESSFPIDKESILKKYNIKANVFNWWIRKYRPDLRCLIQKNRIKHCEIMILGGYSQKEYSEIIGVSDSTISNWYCTYIKGNNKPKHKTIVKDLDYKKSKYKEWINSGLSKRSFCKKNNINYSSFKAWKKYYEEY